MRNLHIAVLGRRALEHAHARSDVAHWQADLARTFVEGPSLRRATLEGHGRPAQASYVPIALGKHNQNVWLIPLVVAVVFLPAVLGIIMTAANALCLAVRLTTSQDRAQPSWRASMVCVIVHDHLQVVERTTGKLAYTLERTLFPALLRPELEGNDCDDLGGNAQRVAVSGEGELVCGSLRLVTGVLGAEGSSTHCVACAERICHRFGVMRSDEQEAQWVKRQKWFHSLDLGSGLVSKGRYLRNRPPNYTLFGVLDLLRHIPVEGMRVVDVGTMDGLVALGLKQRGASEVIATDLAKRPTFEFARDKLQLDIDYRVPVQVLDLPESIGEASADLIVMAGVIYHVLDPVSVIGACRRALRRDGLLILESTYLYSEGGPRAAFNPADVSSRGIERANVFWRPSEATMLGMVQLAGFEVLASVAVDARLAILARARRPSELSERPRRIGGIHRHYDCNPHYQERLNFASLEGDDSEPSEILYTGPRGRRRIFPSISVPEAPFQPRWAPPPGAAKYRSFLASAAIHAASETARWRCQAKQMSQHSLEKASQLGITILGRIKRA